MNGNKTVGIHAPVIILLAVMAITAPALISLGGRIFPESPLRQMALVGVSEIGLILWHIANNNARGDKQESISRVMVWVSMIGVASLAGLDILLESADSKKLPVTFDANMIGTALMVALIGLIATHLIGVVSYMHNDPDKYLERAMQRSRYAIEAESAAQIERNAPIIATELAQIRSQSFVDGQRHTTQTRVESERRAIIGSAADRVIDSPRPAQQIQAAPAGPTQAEISAMIQAAVAKALANAQPQGVAMNADTPTQTRVVTPDRSQVLKAQLARLKHDNQCLSSPAARTRISEIEGELSAIDEAQNPK